MKETRIRFGKTHGEELDEFLGRSCWDFKTFEVGIVQPFYEAQSRPDSSEVLVLMRMSKHASEHRVYLFENRREFREFKKTFHRLDPETGRRW
jgi:hypothetical protein